MSSVFHNKFIKALTTFTLAFLLLVTSLFIENSLASQKITEPDYILKTETNLENFQVLQQDKEEFQNIQSKFFFNFPKKIKTVDAELTHINLFKDTNLILGKNTTLETLIATSSDKRIHQKLEQGELIIDNRQTNQSVPSIQTSNVFFQPFTNGIYYISNKNGNVTLGAVQGSFLVGIFNSQGELSNKLIIHRNQQVDFPSTGLNPNDLKVSSLASIPHINKFKFSEFFSIDDSILEGELFQLVFKQRNITPQGSPSWQASFQAINFNQNKKDFLNIFPFYQKLEEAKMDIRTNQSKNLSNLLVESRQIYNDTITKFPDSAKKFNQTANQNLQLISGLSPLSDLNDLKIFLTDTFSQNLEPATALKTGLSLLEDINYGYDNSKPNISVKSEQVLNKVFASQGFKDLQVEDKVNLLVVIDNILSTYQASYTLELFQARELVASNILENIEDPALAESIQTSKINYLQEVIARGQSESIDSAKAKRIAFFLVDTLPEDLQADLRSQINNIDN